MVGGLFFFIIFIVIAIDVMKNPGIMNNYQQYLFFVFLFPLVGVICHYGGEFIDYLKKFEQSLEYMEKNMDHLEGIEESLKNIRKETGLDLEDIEDSLGEKFIDHLNEIEDRLKNMERSMDCIRRETDLHLEGIEDSLKSKEHDDDI